MKKYNKVCLLGAHYTKSDAPFFEEYDIWSVSTNVKDLPRVDRIFEMHREDVCKERAEMINAFDCKVVCQVKHEFIKNSEPYPFEMLCRMFSIEREESGHITKKHYVTNSLSYMIAMAIMEGYEEIHLYGVMMSALEEYGIQLPSCEYFIGCARGFGCRVVIHGGNLCNCDFLYGGY